MTSQPGNPMPLVYCFRMTFTADSYQVSPMLEHPATTQSLANGTATLLPPLSGPYERSSIAEHCPNHSASEEPIRRDPGFTPFDTLPDETLLGIFDFCVSEVNGKQGWKTLAHVCRRWRSIIFATPRSLGVRLVCKIRTPVREMLDVWPTSLPISIDVSGLYSREDQDNVLTALKHKDRVSEIYVMDLSNSALETLAAAMEDPFDQLTHIALYTFDDSPPMLRDSFLGGSAPRLRSFYLSGISFPALPKFILSATNLVSLRLQEIPRSGYISPQVMVNCLCMLTRLQRLYIQFYSSRSRTITRPYPLPVKRIIHPTLAFFAFVGVSEYLDYLFDHVDTPLIKYIDMRLFNPPILDAPRISQFIGRTETLEAFNQAHMLFYRDFVDITLSSREWISTLGGGGGDTLQVMMSIKYCRSQWRVWSLTQGLRSSLPPFATPQLERTDTVEASYMNSDWEGYFDQDSPLWADHMKNSRWLRLLSLFPAVENLYLSEGIAPHVVRALQGSDAVGKDSPTKALPALQSLFIEGLQSSGPVRDAIGKVVAARKLSGNLIAVQRWEVDVKRASASRSGQSFLS